MASEISARVATSIRELQCATHEAQTQLEAALSRPLKRPQVSGSLNERLSATLAWLESANQRIGPAIDQAHRDLEAALDDPAFKARSVAYHDGAISAVAKSPAGVIAVSSGVLAALNSADDTLNVAVSRATATSEASLAHLEGATRDVRAATAPAERALKALHTATAAADVARISEALDAAAKVSAKLRAAIDGEHARLHAKAAVANHVVTAELAERVLATP